MISLADSLGIDAGAWAEALRAADAGANQRALEQLRIAQAALDAVQTHVVRQARDPKGHHPLSWAEIGHWLGVTKQAVQRRYARIVAGD